MLKQADMSQLSIEPVVSRRQRREFLNLPWQLYRDDPLWVPPLRMDQKQLVGYSKHPFYENAEVQTFLARRGDRPCGRIAAILNHAHNAYHQEHIGFFGFFESTDDPAVAGGLFNAARRWLEQYDVTAIRGPVNPSLNYTCGLLIDGFDRPPFFLMTYNPPYYAELIEQAGFEKVQDLYAYWGHSNMLGTLDRKLRFIVDATIERFEIKRRALDRRNFSQDVRTFLDIYNRSLVGSWGFVPMSEAEVEQQAAGLRYLIEPRLAVTAEIEGKPVAACFGLLDYNPRIRQIDGRLFPFGFLRLLRKREQIKNIRVLAANVLPEYHGWGIGLVLLEALVPLVREWGIQECEFSWILESNKLSRGSLERGGAKRYKTYRLYDWKLDTPAE